MTDVEIVNEVNQAMELGRKQGINQGKFDALNSLHAEMRELWRKYKADPTNVPKPDFMTAYTMAEVMLDKLIGRTPRQEELEKEIKQLKSDEFMLQMKDHWSDSDLMEDKRINARIKELEEELAGQGKIESLE